MCDKGLHNERRLTGDTWVISGNGAQPEQVHTELAQKEQKILSLVWKMAESSGDEGAANTPLPLALSWLPASSGLWLKR